MIDFKDYPKKNIDGDIFFYKNITFPPTLWFLGPNNNIYSNFAMVKHIIENIVNMYERQFMYFNVYKHENSYDNNKIGYSVNLMETVIFVLCDKLDALDFENRKRYYDVILNNGFYPSDENLKYVIHCNNNIIKNDAKYVIFYKAAIDFVIKLDIHNKIQKVKNIVKNIEILKILLLIYKYTKPLVPFVIIKHLVIPFLHT